MMQHKPQLSLAACQPLFDGLWHVDNGQHITATLLTGTDGHLLPVPDTLIKSIAIQFDFATLTPQRRDGRNAGFGGLLYGIVHALTPTQGLAQFNHQR